MNNRIHMFLIPLLSFFLVTAVLFFLNTKWKSEIETYKSLLDVNQKELADLRTSQEILKQNSSQLRQYMNLPPLSFEDEENNPVEKETTGNFELAAYDAVAFLKDFSQNQIKLNEYNERLKNSSFSSLLERLGLGYSGSSSFKGILRKNENTYFSIEYKPDEGLFLVQAVLGDSEITGAVESKAVADFLASESEKMDLLYETSALRNNELLLLYRDRVLKNALLEHDLRFSEQGMSGSSRYIPINRIDGSELVRAKTDLSSGGFVLGHQEFDDLETLKEGILSFVTHSDIRTESQIIDDNIEEEIRQLLSDKAFNVRLKDLGYHPVIEPREDNDYIYYDFLNDNSVRRGSLALQKDFGEVYLMDGDDIPIRSLKTFSGSHDIVFNFQTADSKEITGDQNLFIPAQGSETFLLIGSHEHNADTMILLHCDSSSSEMRMLSIPRDLYYEGRKINSIYREYGPLRLVSELSSLTGLSITKYIAIDMYAFIDVVNILGGIDVSLDEALVDPTYKVKNDGKWSTLYYPPGTHHLDGIAALRIARSRHTSSDFERAVRQQKVIESLKDKAGGMGLGDVDKIYNLIQTTGKYVQSNLNTTEMVKYFLSYKDFTMAGQNVMNTDNILYATYTNLYRLSKEEQKAALEDPNYYKGGWIVLPKENDWSIIKTYVRTVLTKS